MEKFRFDLKTCLNLCTLLASFGQYTYILVDVINIKLNTLDSGISFKEGANVRLLYHMVIKHFVSKTFFGIQTFLG